MTFLKIWDSETQWNWKEIMVLKYLGLIVIFYCAITTHSRHYWNAGHWIYFRVSWRRKDGLLPTNKNCSEVWENVNTYAMQCFQLYSIVKTKSKQLMCHNLFIKISLKGSIHRMSTFCSFQSFNLYFCMQAVCPLSIFYLIV